MSQVPPPLPPPERGGQRSSFPHGCLAAFLIPAGIVLLLPGLCTEAVWKSEYRKPNFGFPSLPTIVFAVEFAGATFIVVGIAIAIFRLVPPQGSRLATAFLILAILVLVSIGMMMLLAMVR